MIARLAVLAGVLSALVVSPASASDNSTSTPNLYDLLSSGESNLPAISITKPKIPSYALLRQQLATQTQILAQSQTALTMAQGVLASAIKSGNEIEVFRWTRAVAADQNLVARVQAQVAQLNAEMSAAGP